MAAPIGYHRAGSDADVLRTLDALIAVAATRPEPGAELEHAAAVTHARLVALAAAIRYGTIQESVRRPPCSY